MIPARGLTAVAMMLAAASTAPLPRPGMAQRQIDRMPSRVPRLRCLAPHAGSPSGVCDVRLTRRRVRQPNGAKRKVWWCARCQEVRG